MMQPRPILRSSLTRKRIGFLAGVAAVAPSLTSLVATACGGQALAKLKLPAERTSPTGNYFTLEAYDAPTSSKAVVESEVEACTSAHTRADAAIVPTLFTLSTTGGGSVAESTIAAKKPSLEYDYNGTISWAVG
jgi:hypothetical protein